MTNILFAGKTQASLWKLAFDPVKHGNVAHKGAYLVSGDYELSVHS